NGNFKFGKVQNTVDDRNSNGAFRSGDTPYKFFLSKMISRQASQAQVIVVSLRRPMIESAKRTIGVTQARGAYTQVLGLKLQHQETAG
ncbi:MAG: hypothetical protein WBA24_21745, partial [Geitlerinemataceae cyanobacterium]